jgi:hypothetical protein
VNKHNPFDLEALQVSEELIAKQKKPAAQTGRPKKWRREFVRMPWSWAERLQATRRVSTYRLALLLLYEHWRTGGRTIPLSNVGLAGEGLDRRAKWRALADLEQIGLVEVRRRRRRAPEVILQHMDRN